MNIKTMTVCLVCAGALLVSCGSNREKKAGDTDEMEKYADVRLYRARKLKWR